MTKLYDFIFFCLGFNPRRGPIWVDGEREIQIQKHAAQHAGRAERQRANYLAEVEAVMDEVEVPTL